MIDHMSFGVADIARARAFYDAVLAPLGCKRMVDEADEASGYGSDYEAFWINLPLDQERSASAGNGAHVCFIAPSKEAVQDFYSAGLANGGRDNGVPGQRPEYGDNYYGAFLFDPDGNNVGAVHYLW